MKGLCRLAAIARETVSRAVTLITSISIINASANRCVPEHGGRMDSSGHA